MANHSVEFHGQEEFATVLVEEESHRGEQREDNEEQTGPRGNHTMGAF